MKLRFVHIATAIAGKNASNNKESLLSCQVIYLC